jgi:hypothetical protein
MLEKQGVTQRRMLGLESLIRGGSCGIRAAEPGAAKQGDGYIPHLSLDGEYRFWIRPRLSSPIYLVRVFGDIRDDVIR